MAFGGLCLRIVRKNATRVLGPAFQFRSMLSSCSNMQAASSFGMHLKAVGHAYMLRAGRSVHLRTCQRWWTGKPAETGLLSNIPSPDLSLRQRLTAGNELSEERLPAGICTTRTK